MRIHPILWAILVSLCLWVPIIWAVYSIINPTPET